MKIRSMMMLLAALPMLTAQVHAQAPGVAIEAGVPLSNNPAILRQAGELKEAGKLLKSDRVAELVAAPVAEKVGLVPVRTQPLAGREVAALAAKGFVRIGWYYLCPHCDNWHLNLAAGYAVDHAGAVVTCHHCVRGEMEMKEGYLIAVDDAGKVYPVKSVIAANRELDAAVLRLADCTLEPLPLQDAVGPGDAAYLYSEPFGHLGYFSSGIVNRFYWKSGNDGDATTLKDAERLRVNVSTEWAPGSSGAAIVDACGNAIGHVSTIETLGSKKPPGEKGGSSQTMITLHEAVPARGVMLLLGEARSRQ